MDYDRFLQTVCVAFLVLVPITILLAARGWWWERSRGICRCLKCGYRLVECATLRCPECSYLHRSRKAMTATRRSPKWLAAALVSMLASAYSVVAASRSMPLWPVPASWLARLGGQHNGIDILSRELSARLRRGGFADSELASLARQMCSIRDPASLLAEVEYRRKWPRTLPFVVRFRDEVKSDRLLWGYSFLVHSREPGLLTSEHPVDWRNGALSPRTVNLGLLPPDGVLRFQLELMSPRWGRKRGLTFLTTEVVDSIVFVESIDDVLTPVESAELDSVVATLASGELYIHPLSIQAPFIGTTLEASDYQGTEIAFRWQLRWKGTIVGEADYSFASPRSGGGRYCEIRGDLSRVVHYDPSSSDWQIRIVGEPALALANVNAIRYWRGEQILVPTSLGVKRFGHE